MAGVIEMVGKLMVAAAILAVLVEAVRAVRRDFWVPWREALCDDPERACVADSLGVRPEDLELAGGEWRIKRRGPLTTKLTKSTKGMASI